MERKRGRGRRRQGCRGDEDLDVRLSKSLSFVLRHGAARMRLNMSSDGFLLVEDLLSHPQFHSFSLEDIERVVANNDKQRFKLRRHPSTGQLEIRANQGHSFQVVDLELREVHLDSPDCPKEAVHGSYLKHWPSIRTHGLSRMKRTHIHLAPGLPEESTVISDGILFFWSDNGVLLTPGDTDGRLAAKYFTRAVQLKPTNCELPLE
ncbi:tRNA 2'-phosphotransferase 1 isoform X2 [Scleropages formosus]|uniref:2'-phosphotransferase n=1 Tax=Scleropages formosus TaxID=113540 RepID=A0A8C9RBX7_SCLFO|nr:tRNA 2'-phosphotransferase 1 isoform X2 [Scleropages formosus]